tara:strand:+ start:72 stop:782 length:711 start_codon:yes stop_codon:yes gene_type:complete
MRFKFHLTRQDKILRSTFGKDMPKSFYIKPPIISGKQEIALKAARIREANVLKSKVKSIRKATATRIKSKATQFGPKAKLFKKTYVWSKTPTKIDPKPPKIKVLKRTPFGKLVQAKTEQLTGRAVTISKKRGFIHGERTAKKLGVTFPKGLKEMKTQFTKETKYWKRPSEKGSKIYRAKFGDPYTKGEKITHGKRLAKQDFLFEEAKKGRAYFDVESQGLKAFTKKELKKRKLIKY